MDSNFVYCAASLCSIQNRSPQTLSPKMKDPESAIYISPRTPRSFWNEYRIYENRVELEFRLFFTKIVIPLDELKSCQVYPPSVIRSALWALKLDWADLFEHVGIHRINGMFKQLRFTPIDPKDFVSQIENIVQ